MQAKACTVEDQETQKPLYISFFIETIKVVKKGTFLEHRAMSLWRTLREGVDNFWAHPAPHNFPGTSTPDSSFKTADLTYLTDLTPSYCVGLCHLHTS